MCKFENCSNIKIHGHGYCSKHYSKLLYSGKIPAKTKCSIEDCNRSNFGHNLCKLHYQRQPHILKLKLDWQRRNKEKRKQSLLKYHASDKHKQTSKRYRNTSKGKLSRKVSWNNYRCTKIKACPSWVDKKAIKEIYSNCPKGYHVDHIIPLRGKNVCGLHVPWNLQYLTPTDNIKKGNRL